MDRFSVPCVALQCRERGTRESSPLMAIPILGVAPELALCGHHGEGIGSAKLPYLFATAGDFLLGPVPIEARAAVGRSKQFELRQRAPCPYLIETAGAAQLPRRKLQRCRPPWAVFSSQLFQRTGGVRQIRRRHDGEILRNDPVIERFDLMRTAI